MPSGVFEITEIPADKVQEVKNIYGLDNPTKIETKKQDDGLWTVIATFPGNGREIRKFGV